MHIDLPDASLRPRPRNRRLDRVCDIEVDKRHDSLRRHIEALMGEGVSPTVWQRLADLCRRAGDRSGIPHRAG